MLNLENVTLASVSGVRTIETIQSMIYSCKQIKFKSVRLITPEIVTDSPDYFEIIKCRPLDYKEYNEFVFLELYKYIDTQFCLLVQNDSAVVRPYLWDNEWLKYSYIGAPWPNRENSYMANDGNRSRVGNGGFSLRDYDLMSLPSKLGMELRQEQSYYHEDGNICCYWKKEFLENGIKFAPVDVAARFSFETPVEENLWGNLETFGFHKYLSPRTNLSFSSWQKWIYIVKSEKIFIKYKK